MSTPTACWGSSVSQHLHAIKGILRDPTFDAKIATALDKVEFDVLEQDAIEVLRLIRSWRNTVAPINQMPPEIIALIPDFWDMDDRDQDVIALTHVCRAWREVFVPQSSLWTHFDCVDWDKTRVYLERSKSSLINLSLDSDDYLSPCDPFFQIVPCAIGRLKSLSIDGTPGPVQDIAARLSRPAPLLEKLSIRGGCQGVSHGYPALTSTLFNDNLSSLRELCLQSIRTELPWRNMVNLTSFTLAHTSPVSVGQFLDFFDSAPHLRKVELNLITPTSGAQNGRLVSMACLKRMDIIGGGPPSLLLDHLLIPVGAKLTTQRHLRGTLIEDHLPRSFDNLRNFSGFTTIQLHIDAEYPSVVFSGPNGEVAMILLTYRPDWTYWVLESLTRLDTSKTERLNIDCGSSPSGDLSYRALLPMTNLRTLTLSRYENPDIFVHALDPSMCSPGVVVCPKLEELVIETLDIKKVMGMAAARASRGAKLKSVRIVSQYEFAQVDVLELNKHVLHVECGPEIQGADDDDGNEEG